MKKLVKLSLIIPAVFIVGLVLDIVGNGTGNDILARVGMGILSYGVPATMFILVVIGLILLITGRLSDDGKERKSDVTFRDDEDEYVRGEERRVDELTAAEREAEKIADINSTYGYSSRLKVAEYQMEHSAKIYKNSNKREKVLGWLFFGFLMTDFAMIMVFAFLGIIVGMFICLGIFAGTIIISLIVKLILEKVSLSKKVNFNKYDLTTGRVLSCLLSGYGTTGNRRTTHVSGVTYRILMDVDGKQYNAYSLYPYDEGDLLNVMVRKNGRGVAKIIGREQSDNGEQTQPAANTDSAEN